MLDSYNITRAIISDGSSIWIVYYPSIEGEQLHVKYRRVTYNAVFLVALIMAVPGISHRLRIKILLLGLLMLFPLQVLHIILTVFNYYAWHMTANDQKLYSMVVCNGLAYGRRVFSRLDGQLFPIVIWVALFFYYKWYGQFFKKRQIAQS